MKKHIIIAALLLTVLPGCAVLETFGLFNQQTGKLNQAVDKFIVRLCEEPLEVRLAIREEFARKGVDTKMACEVVKKQ